MQQHSSKKTLYFTFGRFQPFTIAHEGMFNFIYEMSKDTEHCICISPTNDSIKNIFTWDERVGHIHNVMPHIQINNLKESRLDVIIKDFTSRGYSDLVFVIGKDRINDFQWIYKYKDDLGYSSFSILEYGNRIDDTISATNARLAAKQNDYTKFRQLVSAHFNDAQALSMYNTIKERLL